MLKLIQYLNYLFNFFCRYKIKLPVTHSTVVKAPEVALKFHNNPKNHIHMKCPQEEVPVVSVSLKAEVRQKIPYKNFKSVSERIK